jgi:hypothetical protein
VKAYMREHPEITRAIEAKVYEAVGLGANGGPVAEVPVGPIEGEVVDGAEAPEANGQPAAAAA